MYCTWTLHFIETCMIPKSGRSLWSLGHYFLLFFLLVVGNCDYIPVSKPIFVENVSLSIYPTLVPPFYTHSKDQGFCVEIFIFACACQENIAQTKARFTKAKGAPRNQLRNLFHYGTEEASLKTNSASQRHPRSE